MDSTTKLPALPREMAVDVHTKTWTWFCVEAVLEMAPLEITNTVPPSGNDRTKEPLLSPRACGDLQGVMLSESNQHPKDSHRRSPSL